MRRLSFFVRELPLAALIACMVVPTAMSASAAWAGDSSGKSTGGNASAGKDGGRTAESRPARQTRSLYTFERGLNGELIVRDASGRRVGTGTRDERSSVLSQDR